MKISTARWTMWLLGAAALAVAVFAALVFWAASRLDIRAEIESEVERATGRAFTIRGDVGVSYWPVIGVSADDAALANVADGRAPAFAEIAHLDVGVEFWPLLRGELAIRKLVFDQARFFLEIDAAGAPNWVFTPPREAAARPEGAATPAPRADQALTLRELRFNDAALSLFDARANESWDVSAAHIDAAIGGPADPVNVAGSFQYRAQPVDVAITVPSLQALSRGASTPLTARLQNTLLSAQFEGAAMPASGRIAGLIKASGPSLRAVSGWLGAPIEGGYGFAGFSVAGRFDVTADEVAFSNATFVLDELRGRGDFNMSSRAAKPYLSGRIEMFAADFNPYIFGAAADGAAQPDGSSEAPANPARPLDVKTKASDARIDFSGLSALNCDLEIITNAMLMQQVRLERSRLGLVINDGHLIATLHELQFYGGSGSGRLSINARNSDAVVIEQSLLAENIEARAFLGGAANFTAIEGKAELSLSLRAQGRSQADFINSADGEGHLEVVNGALSGVDLGGVSRTIQNARRGELFTADARTAFSGFSASFALSDGVLASDNLSFNTPELILRGVGVFDLNARRLDVRLAPRSPRGGIVVPFAARGPFAEPEFASDISDRALREISAQVSAVKAAARAQ